MLGKVKSHLRDSVLACMSATGVLESLAKSRIKGGISVLAYHRVLTEEDRKQTFSSRAIVVGNKTFERQMEYLLEHFNIVSLNEFQAIWTGSLECPKRAVMVTFDDGWKDNYSRAFPILEALSIPAAIFLSTDYVGSSDVFWQEEMCFLINSLCHKQPGDLSTLSITPSADKLTTMSSARRSDVIRRFVDNIKKENYSVIDEVLDSLRKLALAAGLTRNNKDQFMSWEEVREMAQSGIDFGSHTASHRMLDRISADEVRSELQRSKDKIELEIGKTVTTLAYPNGNYDGCVQKSVVEVGFKAAFTMDPGVFSLRNGNILQVKRVNIHEGKASSDRRFLASIAGLQ